MAEWRHTAALALGRLTWRYRGISPGGTLVAACCALGSSLTLLADHGPIPERALRASVRRGVRRRLWLEADPLRGWLPELWAMVCVLTSARVYERGHGDAEGVAGDARKAVAIGWSLEACAMRQRAIRGALQAMEADRGANGGVEAPPGVGNRTPTGAPSLPKIY
jgi:hypothetical protein